MDAIKLVTDQEARAKERKAQAQAQAKALVEQAGKEAQAKLDQARKEAQAQVREKMARAEALGEERTRAVLVEYEADCQSLREGAQARLERAAELIVGRVVRD